MGELTESDKSFLGILVYTATHLLCLYYLAWILVKSIALYEQTHVLSDLEKELLSLQVYFPDNSLRILIPACTVGFIVGFFTFSYCWTAKKRREYGSIFDKKTDKPCKQLQRK